MKRRQTFSFPEWRLDESRRHVWRKWRRDRMPDKSRKLSKTHSHAKSWKSSLPKENRVAEIEWRRVVYNSHRKPSVFVRESSVVITMTPPSYCDKNLCITCDWQWNTSGRWRRTKCDNVSFPVRVLVHLIFHK